jgi:hypothetical protein
LTLSLALTRSSTNFGFIESYHPAGVEIEVGGRGFSIIRHWRVFGSRAPPNARRQLLEKARISTCIIARRQ